MMAAVVFDAVWSQLEENAIVLFENIYFGVNYGIDAKVQGTGVNSLTPIDAKDCKN